MAGYDSPFWMRRRGGTSWFSQNPAWEELHDYDFEMRGPYETGRLLDAYIEWREFRDEERRAIARQELQPADSAYEQLYRWDEWRRERRRRQADPRARDSEPRIRGRRRGPIRDSEWRRGAP